MLRLAENLERHDKEKGSMREHNIYKEFISHIHMHEKAVRILLKGYLPISLLPPSKLQEILDVTRQFKRQIKIMI